MKLIQTILFLSLLTSCVTTRPSKKECPIDSASKFEKIAGRYSNLDDSTEYYHENLIAVLEQKMKTKDSLIDWKNVEVELKTTKRKLNVTGYKNDSIIYAKTFHGKRKQNYFSIRRRIVPVGLPLFYFFYLESKINVSVDSVGNLQINQGKSQYGMLFLFSAGQNDYPNYHYKKINPENILK